MSLCHFSKQWKYLGSYILCLRYFLPLPSPPAPPPLRQSLDYAGDNAADLQAVLDKYEAEGDGLKLAAAEFLIGNMRLHGLWAVFCFCAVANQPVLRSENVPQCSSNALF